MDEKRKFLEKKSRSDHQAQEEEEQEEEQKNEEQKQEQQSPKLSEKTKPKGPIRYVSNPNSSRSSNQATVRRTGRLSKGNAAYDSSQEEVVQEQGRNETNHGAMIARNESVPGAYVGRGRALGLNVEGWIERDTSMDRSNQSNRDVSIPSCLILYFIIEYYFIIHLNQLKGGRYIRNSCCKCRL